MTLRRLAAAAPLAVIAALAACKPATPQKSEPATPPVVEPAACAVASPPEGSSDRAAILEALRPTVETMTGKPVDFTVTRLDVACDYARLIADPKAKAGGDHYETVDALMVRKDGAWTLGLVAAAEEDSPPPGEQYKARYPDAPAGLVN